MGGRGRSFGVDNGIVKIKLYRGFSASSKLELNSQINDMLAKKARVSSEKTSASGRGLYFTTEKSEAENYAKIRQSEQKHRYSNVVIATLHGKIAKYYDLSVQKTNEYNELMSKAIEQNSRKLGNKANELRNMDLGDYAKLKGYDGINVGDGTFVVVNQGKLHYD